MDGYIVLSQNQRDWMRKVMKNMVSLTAYYSFAKQPLKESDYENIVMAFSNYTKKSQNNELIIKSAVALLEYLDGIVKNGSRLDKDQMGMLEMEVDELFDVVDAYQNQLKDPAKEKEALMQIKLCGQSLKEYSLSGELQNILKEYLDFCREADHQQKTQDNRQPMRSVSARGR